MDPYQAQKAEAAMAIYDIQSYIDSIEKNLSVFEEKNFDKRMEVLDSIEFQLTDQIDALEKTTQPGKLDLVRLRIEKVKSELEEIDINLFQRLRAIIKKGMRGDDLKALVNEYVSAASDNLNYQDGAGYDKLDLFMNGLLQFRPIPETTKELEVEMVYYQKTPAQIVYELAERSNFTKEDIFFDLGSGMGQVAILINLLTEVKVRGIEFEPAFCDYAKACATELNLSDVTFINDDARNADYSTGTVFFMFTPFQGKILLEVLEILRKESLQRKIRIITLGPCTAQVALQNWLHFEDQKETGIYRLGFFTSLLGSKFEHQKLKETPG